MNARLTAFISLLLTILLLGGCANSVVHCNKNCHRPQPRVCRGALCLIATLRSQGVKVNTVGQEVMLVLPSDRFFYPDSSHLNPSAYPILNEIAKLLNCYIKITVKVAGYTDNGGVALRNLALSRQQAQNVAAYLTWKGTDTRLLYAIGYGNRYPIASNQTAHGRQQNRRIQITLRYIPDPN